MKKAVLYLIIIPIIGFTQSYNGPESIEYNPSNGNYFISNSGNGQILELDNNNLNVFVDNLNVGPHGLELIEDYIDEKLVGQILFACSGGELYGYDINGNEVLNHDLDGSFLNGITKKYDPFTGEFDLFITDFSDKKLYRYNIQENTHYEICSFSKNPNGVYYDSMNDRLIVVCWGWNAPIYEIDLISETYSTLINTGLSNLDGIGMDQCGNFYVSAWSSNAIHKYSSDFSTEEIIITGLNNPADIYYNQYDNIIAIPNSGNNTVDFVFSSCDNNLVSETKKDPIVIQQFDLLSRQNTQTNFNIKLYNDGSVEKIWFLK